uniref:Uncharacterized protein n=1 Tax=Clandestinovirus TaxID=2831644 RepID=A0A8F8KSZ9_9VIRU|nr:hypothetical protein KOM_12_256 [Clandestinovirus]
MNLPSDLARVIRVKEKQERKCAAKVIKKQIDVLVRNVREKADTVSADTVMNWKHQIIGLKKEYREWADKEYVDPPLPARKEDDFFGWRRLNRYYVYNAYY